MQHGFILTCISKTPRWVTPSTKCFYSVLNSQTIELVSALNKYLGSNETSNAISNSPRLPIRIQLTEQLHFMGVHH